MLKTSDPRFWGKAAASGAVALGNDLEASDLKLLVSVADTMQAKGRKTFRDPKTNRFRSVRSKRTELIHQLGCRIIKH